MRSEDIKVFLKQVSDGRRIIDERVRNAVGRGLVIINNNQTADERIDHSTKHHNGRGWNGLDAAFGGSLAERFANGRSLTDRQVICASRMLAKYSTQIAAYAEGVSHVEA